MGATRVQWVGGFTVVLGIALFVAGLLEFRPHAVFFVTGGFVLAGLGVLLYMGEMRRLRNVRPF